MHLEKKLLLIEKNMRWLSYWMVIEEFHLGIVISRSPQILYEA